MAGVHSYARAAALEACADGERVAARGAALEARVDGVRVAARVAALRVAAVQAGVWLVAGVLAAGCADDGGPRLDAVAPAAAARNATVTLTGRRLCGASADCAKAAGEVVLGLALPAVRAVVVSYADGSAQIVIPPSAPVGATQLVVTVDERASNALDFEVLP